MVKIVVQYPPQPDPAAFDAHFFGTHVPLTRKVPGLVKFEAARLRTGPDSPNQIYLVAELYFNDKESLKVALKSPEMAACVKDVQDHVPTGNVVHLSDEIQT